MVSIILNFAASSDKGSEKKIYIFSVTIFRYH